jgi:hypothetical protein
MVAAGGPAPTADKKAAPGKTLARLVQMLRKVMPPAA